MPDPNSIYYMVVDEKSTGPYTLDEVILHPAITPETLVWKPGIENWVAAKTLPELEIAFRNQQETPPQYNSNSYQSEVPHDREPQSPEENPYRHQQENHFGYDNRGYHNNGYNRFANNPQYHSEHSYRPHEEYYDRNRNDFRPAMRTNWLPWAIVATVAGFFTSCIGAIFGIIAIVQSNKANSLYAQGFDREGDAANSNAKIMTIIGLIFAGLGILAAIFFSNFFSVFSNLTYY